MTSWGLRMFDPIQSKSPVETSSPLEQVGSNAKEEEIEDDERRTSSDDYPNNKSNSSLCDNDKSDDEDVPHRSMPPPMKARSSDSLQRTPDTTILNSTLQIINDPNIKRPLSSLSDSDDSAQTKNVSQKPKIKKRPKKLLKPQRNTTADITSSDESRERLTAVDEKPPIARGRPTKKSFSEVDTKHSKKSPKSKSNRQKTHISRPTVSSDSSSDEDEKDSSKVVKKPPRKRQKSSDKQISNSTIATSSDDEVNHVRSPSRSPVEVPTRNHISTSYHSDSESNHSSAETAEPKIVDRKKNNVLGKLFGMKSTSEGGKGGKGGKGKGGQVVVITQDDVQNQTQKDSVQKFTSPTSAFNSSSSVANCTFRISIPLDRIDVMRSGISEEKLKLAGYRPTKSPAKKQRKMSTDSWRIERRNHDVMSESDSSSEQMMENPATRPTSYTTPNYSNDRLNNNVDHKLKDLMPYQTHSPNNVDAKLPKIKSEKNDSRKEKMKQVLVKQEKQDELDTKPRDRSSSMNSNSNSSNSHTSYKASRKRVRVEENNSLMPPTNHERMQNGDTSPSSMLVKPETAKKVYVSYFERNDETDHEFR